MAPSCKMCNKQYDLLDTTPVSLSCGHSFCRQCLHGIQKKTSKLKCPTCIKAHVGLPVTELQINYDFLSTASLEPMMPDATSSATSMLKDPILVLVKTSSDMQIPIKILQTSRIADLKIILQVTYGIDADSGFISCQGKRLDDSRTLLEYKISPNSILQVEGSEDQEEIIKPLGKGGFGDVFLIKKKGRNMVLKTVNLVDLNAKARSLAIQEMKLLEELNHPNIVFYEGGYEKNECLHIFMEYCSGGDLARRIELQREEENLFQERQVLSWTEKITEAIAYIHDRKIIHRDIKPANIFLSNSGIIKLGDFGICRVLGDNTTRGSTMIGTAKYTAIEVMNSEGYTTKSDMFSLGCCVYEIAALKTNYPYVQVLLPEVFSESFKSLVVKLLKHDPDDRPDALEVLRLPIFKTATEKQVAAAYKTPDEVEYRRKIEEDAETEQALSNLRRMIMEEHKIKSPKPVPKPRRAAPPPPPPKRVSLSPSVESYLKVLKKFCDESQAGHHPDQKRGLEDIVIAMKVHPQNKHIQIRACLSLSYVTMKTFKEVLSPANRQEIVSGLVNAMENHPDYWSLKTVACQRLLQFGKPYDLVLRTLQLVPLLMQLVKEAQVKKDFYACLRALHLIQLLSTRVGKEFKLKIADFSAIEVCLSVIRDRKNQEFYEEMFKICWSITCNLTDETPANCKRFVDYDGLSLIAQSLSLYPGMCKSGRSIWIAFSNVSEVKELRHYLLKPDLLKILVDHLDSNANGNEMSWDAAKILTHLLCDGERAWLVSVPRRINVVQKIVQAIEKWDLDSEPQCAFNTLRPLWLLLDAYHTPVCQYWAIWTLAKLTRVQCDMYCPMIEKEGGLQLLQQLIKSSSKSPRILRSPLIRIASITTPSSAIIKLAMQISNTCEDYARYGSRNRDLLMKLFVAAAEGELENVEDLSKSRINLNAVSSMTGHNGRTALHLAAANGHTEVVCTLLDAGASVHATDIEGITVLQIAAGKGHLDLVKLLLIYGSDLDAEAKIKGWKAVHFAAVGGHIPVLEVFKKNCDIGVLTRDKKTALHLAVEYGNESAVHWLINAGLNMKLRDASGYTAYDYAVRKGHTNIVAILSRTQKQRH